MVWCRQDHFNRFCATHLKGTLSSGKPFSEAATHPGGSLLHSAGQEGQPVGHLPNTEVLEAPDTLRLKALHAPLVVGAALCPQAWGHATQHSPMGALSKSPP